MRNFRKVLFKLNFWYIALIAVQVTAIIFLILYIPSFLPAAIFFVFSWLISAVSACVLFSRKGTPEVKCAWFVFIASVPIAGAIIYLISSAKKKPCGILKIQNKSETASAGLGGAAGELCGTAYANYTEAEYFSNGSEFFAAAEQEIKKAEKSVYLEFFIINRGHIFNSFFRALEAAKNNGAEIKIITDGIGSAFRAGKREIKKLKELGAEVKIFNRLTPLPRSDLNIRDHRKIITVDGQTAFTGGINLADEYANINSPYGYWKDTGIMIKGDSAKIFEGMFLAMWHGSYEMPFPAANGNKVCLPYYDCPSARSFCEDAYAHAINCAQERLHIFTPYFCIGEKIASALTFAAKRGVEVKIILPHIPDKKYAYAVSKAFANSLRDSGIEFYEYTPGFMHAKSMIADGKLFIGSYNLDFRSAHFNYECGVMFEDEMAEKAEKDFQECLALSSPIQTTELSGIKKFSQFILKLFAPLI